MPNPDPDTRYDDAAVAAILDGLRRGGHDDAVLNDMTREERNSVDRAVLRHNERMANQREQ